MPRYDRDVESQQRFRAHQ